jgi:hypothetical protein
MKNHFSYRSAGLVAGYGERLFFQGFGQSDYAKGQKVCAAEAGFPRPVPSGQGRGTLSFREKVC